MEARGFGSAEEYLAAPDRRLGGCLLLDLNLPGMGGLEMLEQLRAKGDRLPAIIITARRTPPVDERARSAGVLAIFDKPVDSQALLATIESVFNHPSACLTAVRHSVVPFTATPEHRPNALEL